MWIRHSTSSSPSAWDNLNYHCSRLRVKFVLFSLRGAKPLPRPHHITVLQNLSREKFWCTSNTLVTGQTYTAGMCDSRLVPICKVRWDFNNHLTTNLPKNLPVKSFWNRFRFDRTMVMSLWLSVEMWCGSETEERFAALQKCVLRILQQCWRVWKCFLEVSVRPAVKYGV